MSIKLSYRETEDKIDLKSISKVISDLPSNNSWTRENLVESGLNLEMQKLAELTGLMEYWEKSNGLHLLNPRKAKQILELLNNGVVK